LDRRPDIERPAGARQHDDAAGNTTSTDTQVFGWSNGFVVFRETAVMTADDDSKSIAIVPYVRPTV